MSKRTLNYNVYSVNYRLTPDLTSETNDDGHDSDEEGLLLCPASKRSSGCTDPIYFLHFYGMSQPPGAALHTYASADYPLRRIQLIGTCASPPDAFLKTAALLAKYNVGLTLSQRRDWVANTLRTTAKHSLYCALPEHQVTSWSVTDNNYNDEFNIISSRTNSISGSTTSSCSCSDDDEDSYVEVKSPSMPLLLPPLPDGQKGVKEPILMVSTLLESTVIH